MYLIIGRMLLALRARQLQVAKLPTQTVLLLLGPSRLSSARKAWILDFLGLATACMRSVVKVEVVASEIDLERFLPATKLIITHELPIDLRNKLTSEGWTYIDFRVSPVRFLENDYLFAISTNNIKLRSRLRAYRVSDDRIRAEACFLKSSFRYRQFGRVNITPNSVAVFLEKEPDEDSINWLVNTKLMPHVARLREIRSEFSKMYFVTPSAKFGSDDSALATSLGAEHLTANSYSVLAADNIKAVAACRSGILEEAFYFGKRRLILDEVNTPVCDENNSDPEFYNVTPVSLLSSSFWQHLLQGVSPRAEPVVQSRDLLRRAVNDWGSYASVRTVGTKEFEEVVELPYRALFRAMANATLALPNILNHNPQLTRIAGRWIWFTGGTVEINLSGMVFAEKDFGALESKDPKSFSLKWFQADLTDSLVISEDGLHLNGTNQYGTKVSATRAL